MAEDSRAACLGACVLHRVLCLQCDVLVAPPTVLTSPYPSSPALQADGNCGQPWLLSGNYCRATCGRCALGGAGTSSAGAAATASAGAAGAASATSHASASAAAHGGSASASASSSARGGSGKGKASRGN